MFHFSSQLRNCQQARSRPDQTPTRPKTLFESKVEEVLCGRHTQNAMLRKAPGRDWMNVNPRIYYLRLQSILIKGPFLASRKRNTSRRNGMLCSPLPYSQQYTNFGRSWPLTPVIEKYKLPPIQIFDKNCPLKRVIQKFAIFRQNVRKLELFW